MDAAPMTRSGLRTKFLDFVFGSLLVGGAPLGTYWLLVLLLGWPCTVVFRHYGDRPAFILQMIAAAIAALAAMAALGFAVFWRIRHRLLPTWLVVFEIIVGLVAAFFFFGFLALCYGPNDDWNG